MSGVEQTYHFAPGDTVRLRELEAVPRVAGASLRKTRRGMARLGVFEGRPLTVRQGTYNPRGIVSFEGTRGDFPAVHFELVKRAERREATPEDERRRRAAQRRAPKWGSAEVEPYGRLRGFYVVATPGSKILPTFVAPLPDGGFTYVTGDAFRNFEPEETA